MKSAIVTIAMLLTVSACGGHGSSPDPATPSRDRITYDEMKSINVRTAYDAVQQLRPNWLNKRGTNSFRSTDPIMLYQNGARIGTVSELRNITINDVEEIRYLDAMAATQIYGTGHRSGAIILSIRTGGR